MRKIVVALTALGMILSIFAVIGTADDAAHKYVGTSKCKTCHKSEAKGNQFGKWSESKHAKAYEALASEAAIAIGKEKGIDNPQTSDQCLTCHVTGYSAAAELKAESYDQTEGVGCEACHGAGADYKKMKVMKDQAAAIAAGLVIPTEETCKGCHNENSPTFKSFNFEEASAVIAHPKPEKK
ncbi:MAG: cytochrome c family protein [candidate division Zixibacteria bacterium]